MSIRVLSVQLAAQIAAGEVVERPASVVKELIENALDAGADELKIEVRDGGKRLIRVGDNGSGIPAAEVELAFVHHATSKLASSEDLFAIRTLGFRGEALPSIASVSHLTALTRAAEDETGTELKLSGGKLQSRAAHAAPRGTLVSVENLFYNVPARLKFLKSTATETGHIHELINRYALAYPAVRFSLTSENRLIFQSPGSGAMGDALVAVYGIETAKAMLALPHPLTTAADAEQAREITVFGFVSQPALSRANRSHMNFFVNGRSVQDRSLAFAVTEAYHTLLQVGRYPLSIIMLQLPPDEVDVNVHPTKAEVRFRDTHRVFSAVQRAVRQVLLAHTPEPFPSTPGAWPTAEERQSSLRHIGQFNFDIQRAHLGGGTGTFDLPRAFPDPHRGPPSDSLAGDFDGAMLQPGALGTHVGPAATGDPASPQRLGATSPEPLGGPVEPAPSPDHLTTLQRTTGVQWPVRTDAAGPFAQPSPEPVAGEPVAAEPVAAESVAAERLPMLRVLGQVARTYIIAEGPAGIFLIDQHAAHERVLYEKLRRSRLATATDGNSQALLEPLAVELGPHQAARLNEQLDLLRSVGFQLEPFGGSAWLLRGVPLIMSEGDPRQALVTILDEMADEREWLRPGSAQPLDIQREAMLIASVCKQGAIKAGRVMSLPEMQELIHQLEQSESPRTCPHGRPTVIRLALDQLARQFGRG